MHIVETVRNNIQKLREKHRLSHMALADAVGMSTNNIGQILRGEHSPTIVSLEKIAKVFNVPITTLFEEQGEPHEKAAKDIHS